MARLFTISFHLWGVDHRALVTTSSTSNHNNFKVKLDSEPLKNMVPQPEFELNNKPDPGAPLLCELYRCVHSAIDRHLQRHHTDWGRLEHNANL